jgi:hypothetical protein
LKFVVHGRAGANANQPGSGDVRGFLERGWALIVRAAGRILAGQQQIGDDGADDRERQHKL